MADEVVAKVGDVFFSHPHDEAGWPGLGLKTAQPSSSKSKNNRSHVAESVPDSEQAR